MLSTLHTNSAPATSARLIEMGVEPYLVASAIDCVLARRLARRLCRHCRRAVCVAGSLVGVAEQEEVEVFTQVGCRRCRQTGYRGRLGLFEVMTVSDEIRALIIVLAPAVDIAATAVAQGMRTFAEDGLAKVRAGETTLAEIGRVTG